MAYQYILIPVAVVLITQIIKLSIDKIKGNLNLKNVFLSYGGMPSAHTAFSVSVATLIGMTQGFRSPLFAVALGFTLIVMRDAVTFRNILGQQGKLLNQFISTMPLREQKSMPHFLERIGHSFSEVVIGAGWGAVSTYVLYNLFNR